MAYYFKRDESVAEGVRRIAGEELEAAAAELKRTRGSKRDEAIHEARKSVKKVRALLRLVRIELGASYRAEARALRTAGRTLSDLRDASSVIEILDKLQKRYSKKLSRSMVDPIRRGLAEQKKRTEERGDTAAALREVAATLKAAAKRVKTWPTPTTSFAAIEPGLKATLRKGRDAFSTARKRARPEDYHQWRKRVKDHWYHVRLLENVWSGLMKGYESSLKEVETWLGDDHNLTLLRERLASEPESFGPETAVDSVLSLTEKYQKELRGNAESFGERIHLESPRRFVRRMRGLWEKWQAEPKSLDEVEKAARKSKLAA